MNNLLTLFLLIFLSANIFAQSNPQKIYDTEKDFEKAAAEKGINRAFLEFVTADAICFIPGYPTNCREFWQNSPQSSAFLTWNPTFIDVSSNGVLAYSTGNSVYRPNGKEDKQAFYGEYATVWMRQPNGNYLAVLDMGISHEQANNETKWTSPSDSGKEQNAQKSSAADSSTAFFEAAAKKGLSKAYKTFLAEDVRMLREGKMPIVGKNNALSELKNFNSNISFTKRTVFTEAADMAYITNSYTVTDKSGKQTETGNFLQVWKLRNGKWQIVFDVFLPVSSK